MLSPINLLTVWCVRVLWVDWNCVGVAQRRRSIQLPSQTKLHPKRAACERDYSLDCNSYPLFAYVQHRSPGYKTRKHFDGWWHRKLKNQNCWLRFVNNHRSRLKSQRTFRNFMLCCARDTDSKFIWQMRRHLGSWSSYLSYGWTPPALWQSWWKSDRTNDN